MDTSIVIAIIGSVTSIAVAAITGYLSAQRVVTQLEVKVDLLWKTYIVDAVKASRSSGLVASNSPEAPTEKWAELIPPGLRTQMSRTIRKTSKYVTNPYDIVIETIHQIGLQKICNATSLSPKEVIGTLYIMTERIIDGN